MQFRVLIGRRSIRSENLFLLWMEAEHPTRNEDPKDTSSDRGFAPIRAALTCVLRNAVNRHEISTSFSQKTHTPSVATS